MGKLLRFDLRNVIGRLPIFIRDPGWNAWYQWYVQHSFSCLRACEGVLVFTDSMCWVDYYRTIVLPAELSAAVVIASYYLGDRPSDAIGQHAYDHSLIILNYTATTLLV